jgi:hypothetical protein
MTITAYFDESGIHAGSSVTVLGGFLGPDSAWSELDRNWRATLQKFDLSFFHAVECEQGTGEFLGKHPEPIRAYIAQQFAQIICDAGLQIIGSAFVVDDWRATTPEQLKQRFPSAYIFCFEFCMQKLARWSREESTGEPVRMVFAEQNDYESKALEMHHIYAQSSYFGSAIGDASFAPMKRTPALQAADLLCYETYQRAKAGPAAPVRRILRTLIEGTPVPLQGYFDKESFSMLIENGPAGRLF